MKKNALIHVPGCLVAKSSPSGQKTAGIVRKAIVNSDELIVNWPSEGQDNKIGAKHITNGFFNGCDVLDTTPNNFHRSLGRGRVMQRRKLAGHEQLLVDFPDSGERHWMPYQHLRYIKWVKQRFVTQQYGRETDAEKLRLRMLAQAIKVWNENTGSLSHLDIEPLPHQINLVHHILLSGNYNWLIADDVGLGKTIETGMLLHALKQRDRARRILLITPAGLTKQWQEELYQKFNLDQFQIYGEDFHINEARQWKMYDHVIGSIDRFKQGDHFESLLSAEPWDLVIFDESHRLSRRQYGMKYESSERYDLAKALRERTKNILLLTATPHQGMQDKFVALLELLRPERRNELMTLSLNPEILEDMVFRNHKADVTDSEGNFIFQGKITNVLQVPNSVESLHFDKTLQEYIRKGYAAGEAQGRVGRAIGFVMTVYRKLASSSAAAIYQALCNRLQRLQDNVDKQSLDEDAYVDERFSSEAEELRIDDSASDEFFAGEIELLKTLIDEAAVLKANDQKIRLFLDEVIEKILGANTQEKVLIFTEYRTTQRFIQEKLAARYGDHKVSLINGSMSHNERSEAIAQFEDEGQFLISTEAGGEGINLQKACHIMVNYDLPWNPMRLVQRIGRLYRYGQKKKVVVFNIQQDDSLDQKIVNLMYDRLETVVGDMAQVQEHEFNEGLKDEILGDLVELIDVTEILEQASHLGIKRTEDRINEALNNARDAASKQQELFAHVASSDPAELNKELMITTEHLYSFVHGMFEQIGIDILELIHNNRVIKIELSKEIGKKLGLRESASHRLDVTLDRALAASRPNTHMLDLNSNLMNFLLEKALEYDFGGITSSVKVDGLSEGAIAGAMLRWQSSQGKRMRQEFVLITTSKNGTEINSSAARQWLTQPAEYWHAQSENVLAQQQFELFEQAAEGKVREVCSQTLLPESIDWSGAGWVGRG